MPEAFVTTARGSTTQTFSIDGSHKQRTFKSKMSQVLRSRVVYVSVISNYIMVDGHIFPSRRTVHNISPNHYPNHFLRASLTFNVLTDVALWAVEIPSHFRIDKIGETKKEKLPGTVHFVGVWQLWSCSIHFNGM